MRQHKLCIHIIIKIIIIKNKNKNEKNEKMMEQTCGG